MNLKTLALFEHLAGTLHFGKTASAKFISPSALSRSIQRLEQECGTALLLRDNRQVRLTAAGKRVLTFARHVLPEWRQLKAEIDVHSQAHRGTLSLFCSVTASQSHLPDLLDNFRHHFPLVEINLVTGDPAEAVDRVITQQSDLAIAIHTPDFPNELAFSSLDTIPLRLIVPKTSNCTALSDIDWSTQQMILPERGPSKRIVHHWLAEQGLRPQVYAQVGGNEAIVSMVALGCGVGIVPQVVIDNSVIANRVNVLHLKHIESYHLGLCCLRSRLQDPLINALFTHAETLSE